MSPNELTEAGSSIFDPMALVVLLLLAVAFPLIGMWDFRRLANHTEEGRADARTEFYLWALWMEWAPTLGLILWWILAGRTWSALGLVPVATGWQWLAIGLGGAGVIAQLIQTAQITSNAKELEKLRDSVGDLELMVPRSDREERLFVALSITAGICEEILYRGLLLAVLMPVIGTWSAVIVSSLIFGLGHIYQGAVGFGKTSLVGLVMALLTVFSGSVFVAILLHAVIDLSSGRMMHAALNRPAADSNTAT